MYPDDDILQALLAGGVTPDQVEAQQPMLEPDPWSPAGELTGLDAEFAAPPPSRAAAPYEGRQIPVDPLESLVPTPSMAPNEAARYVMGKAPGSHAFGVQDTRSNPQSEVERVRQMYAQMAAEQPQQQEGPGQYEREFLEMHNSGGDRNMMLASMFRALAGGDPTDIWKMGQGRQSDYYKGLMQAREMDKRRGQRIDQGLAELLVLSGISPEAAVQVTYDSPLLDIFKAGGMHLGSRLRGQDTQILRTDIGETGDTYRQRVGEIGKNERAMLNADTQLKSARIRKRGGEGGQGMGYDDALFAVLVRNENIDPKIARQYVDGTLDESEVDPETLARIATTEILFKAGGAKKQSELAKGILAREGGEVDRPDVAAATKQADPVQRLKLKQEVARLGKPLGDAIGGWNSLSDRAKSIIAKVGLNGSVSQIRQAGLSPDEQAKAGAVFAQINNFIKELSGAAVSGSEWERIQSELGITGEGFGAFTSPKALGAWLQRANSRYKAHVSNVESEYPGLLRGKGR